MQSLTSTGPDEKPLADAPRLSAKDPYTCCLQEYVRLRPRPAAHLAVPNTRLDVKTHVSPDLFVLTHASQPVIKFLCPWLYRLGIITLSRLSYTEIPQEDTERPVRGRHIKGDSLSSFPFAAESGFGPETWAFVVENQVRGLRCSVHTSTSLSSVCVQESSEDPGVRAECGILCPLSN